MKFLLAVLSSLAVQIASGPADAQNRAEDLADIVEFELLSGWRQPNGTHMAALRLDMEPGWNTYWRVPGETGTPPHFGWLGSENLRDVTVHWPRPQIFSKYGYRILGYKNELILPLEFVPVDSNDSVQVRGQIELGICSDICVPVTFDLSAELKSSDRRKHEKIVRALATTARSAKSHGLRAVRCSLTPAKNGFTVTARIDMPPVSGGDEIAVLEMDNPDVWFSDAKSSRDGRDLTVVSRLVNYGGGAMVVDRSKIRITVFGQSGSVEINGCPGG